MEYTEIIYLVEKKKSEDNIGNVLFSDKLSEKIYAKKQNVKTNEYYNAVAVGKNPTVEFAIKKINYSNEAELDWNDERYSIIRTVEPKNKFDIVLICEKKIGVSNG